MKVYGLSGKSGTGKSYQSMNICRDRGIEAIIDDGLFICRNTVQAGHSAKRDDNKIRAIRTAIFDDPEERRVVADKIKEVAPDSILVIGTSDAMVERICERLELPVPEEMLHIEDISDPDDITTALRQRRENGKHIIPVPTVAIQPQFSGYFMAPFRFLFRRNGRLVEGDEKSVVRPAYSYLGHFYISDSAVKDIVEHVSVKCPGVREVVRASVVTGENGANIDVTAIFDMDSLLGENIRTLQERLAEEVAHMTAFNILTVNVTVKGLKPVRSL
ncbi:MAG: hypothetical protein SOV71_02645 [Anaerovoracaceae bacterium]|nr:hypothetical protein [Bacillota bacterium]MDY2670432.1 hypothetical protein [Anaerovoracaceae bacterium]